MNRPILVSIYLHRFFISAEFGVNLAYEKLTTQSTTAHGGGSGRAVDGDSNAQWHGGSCTHTARENNPWWRVDLGESKKIDMVCNYQQLVYSNRKVVFGTDTFSFFNYDSLLGIW